MLRVLKWLYIAVLIAATGVGIWAARPILAEQTARRAAPLTAHVYSHPFVSILKDTTLGNHTSSLAIDNFFAPEVLSEAVRAITARQAPPFAKGADRDAWSREFASDLMLSLNDHMGRRYRDSLQRLDVANEAKGLVLVRLENVSKAPIEEIRVEVTGGQLFMEMTGKFRSLGTRALRLGTLGAGEKIDLSVLTTQDMSLNGEGPRVRVSAKDQQFPVVVHAQNAPLWPAQLNPKWIAFTVVYLALILAGLGVGTLSLMGMRWSLPARVKKVSPSVDVRDDPAPAPQPVPPPAPLTPTETAAWRRPGSP